MRFHRFDLNLLVVLDTLLTERSVSRTAQILNLSQPAVSAALARLRSYFNDKLLVQAGSIMEPTELGRVLTGRVHELLQNTEELIFTRTTFDPAIAQRRFLVSASGFTALALFKKVTMYLTREAPGVCVSLRPFPLPFQGTVSLDKGSNDFIILPEDLAFPGYPSELLFEDVLVAIAWSGNSAIRRKLTRDHLVNLSHVVYEFDAGRRLTLDGAAYESQGIRRKVVAAVPNYLLIPHLIVGTDHIGVLQKRFADHFAKILPLKVFPLPIPIPPIKLVIQWQAFRDIDPGMVWFRTLLKDIAQTI